MSEPPNVPGRGSPPGIPGWVKVFIIVLVVLVAVVIIVHLMGFRFDHGGAGALLSSLATSLERTDQPL